MTTINNIFRTFGPEYIRLFGHAMPRNHLKTVNAIMACRTSACGIVIYQCQQCGESHPMFRSCGNRHCPLCQNHKTHKWLQMQMKRQLPAHHFLVTFTVPEKLRPFIRSNQRLAYSALFRASSQALKKLAADQRFIGGDLPGFFGILHTWGRQMQYHPHIHYVVPAGAFSKQDQSWHPSHPDFYLPVKGVSKIFRAKFRDEMKKNELYDQIPSQVWDQDWNVNCQAVGNTDSSIKYLAHYVFKVAISDHRIINVKDRKVYLRYRKPKSSRWRTTSLDVFEFIRRFLQHVLPTGFMKIRYYGFLNPNSSVSLQTISALIELSYAFQISKTDPDIQPIPALTCPHCGGILRYRGFILPYIVPYLDSS